MADFDPEIVQGKSLAAAGLCSWVTNIITFYEVFCDVEPKRIALAEATATLNAANEKLSKIMSKIKQLDDALKVHFRPEFLNRVDETIVFHELSKPEITEIVDLLIARTIEQLEGQGIGLELTTDAKHL